MEPSVKSEYVQYVSGEICLKLNQEPGCTRNNVRQGLGRKVKPWRKNA